MKVILKQDIKGVGKKDQVINASDGYARNYLFPKDLAVPADKGNMGNLKAKQESAEFRKEEERQKALSQKEQIEKIVLTISAKIGDNGKLFGAITAKEISEELKKKYNIVVDKKKITMDNIKTLGESIVSIKLFETIVANLKVKVTQE